ncbi:MAG: hypothetical protein R3B09_06690 [Nannocystaceae bacterium]
MDVVLPPDAPEIPYLLRAIVDSDMQVNECVEDNNANETICFVPQ